MSILPDSPIPEGAYWRDYNIHLSGQPEHRGNTIVTRKVRVFGREYLGKGGESPEETPKVRTKVDLHRSAKGALQLLHEATSVRCTGFVEFIDFPGKIE
ncbi:hypothetical protein PISMIDRAFT_10352 [Pisolithus microcarpus 441]|uniref:Uncharacterized protein n=1 Tax=Pisolithus microcarpus 441 TaxID=765257 RepID=A0A0C9Z504_9AGAM|nr:hypothetical protein PISMIDRAFT_10352 [Pisolithus microcarpus 441]